jgi:hypothetical protein
MQGQKYHKVNTSEERHSYVTVVYDGKIIGVILKTYYIALVREGIMQYEQFESLYGLLQCHLSRTIKSCDYQKLKFQFRKTRIPYRKIYWALVGYGVYGSDYGRKRTARIDAIVKCVYVNTRKLFGDIM